VLIIELVLFVIAALPQHIAESLWLSGLAS
jgi:hypothetical protein